MDQYFNQMEKIIKERKTSSRIRFMLQDVLDLRRVNRHKLSLCTLCCFAYIAQRISTLSNNSGKAAAAAVTSRANRTT